MHDINSLPGIYLHIPFCVRKCRYCDFYSVADPQQIPAFVSALCQEIAAAQPFSAVVDTVYLGGGTPSLLPADAVRRILAAIFRRFEISDDAEITLEVNPGTASAETLAGFRKAGVNRLNIGIQSFQDPHLAFLGRIHTAGDGIRTILAAGDAGFENTGIDLMYGIPGQAAALWAKDLRTACGLNPAHLSCYMLTYEPGTPLFAAMKEGRFRPMPENQVAGLFEQTVQYLESRGYLFYEVSNFSRTPDLPSRHNQKYWNHTPYLGFGPSAHSFIENRRSWNVRSVEDYVRRINSGQPPVAGSEVLDEIQLMTESLFLGLRRREGICSAEFEKRYGIDFNGRFAPVIEKYRDRGILAADDTRCRLTRRGMCFLDSIAAEFIDMV